MNKREIIKRIIGRWIKDVAGVRANGAGRSPSGVKLIYIVLIYT